MRIFLYEFFELFWAMDHFKAKLGTFSAIPNKLKKVRECLTFDFEFTADDIWVELRIEKGFEFIEQKDSFCDFLTVFFLFFVEHWLELRK